MPHFLLPRSSLVLPALLAAACVTSAQSANTDQAASPPMLMAAHPLGQTAEQLIGQDVRSTTGQDLGELRDLVVSADGHVEYALISSGGILGVGDIVRAVPFSAFTSTTTGPAKALAVDLSGADWNKAPIVRLDQLASLGTDARGREINQYFGRPSPVARAGRVNTPASNLRLVSDINGQQVLHDGESLGRIDDVYIHQDKAFAVVAPADRTLASEGKIVVGLDQLSWDASTATAARTALTAADLAHAAPLPIGGMAITDRPYRWTPMRADGRPLAPITDGSAAPLRATSRTSITAVRNALHDDPALARAMRRVDVTEQGDQLRLTGVVASEEMKQQLATETMRLAKGWSVKNDITVQSAAE